MFVPGFLWGNGLWLTVSAKWAGDRRLINRRDVLLFQLSQRILADRYICELTVN